jgi:lycopene beta-cyclase
MTQSKAFKDKKILLVDKDAKSKNDRTWCFWEKGDGLFEPIVFKEWRELLFYSQDFKKNLQIDPYKYKLIRGIDFYQYCLKMIEQQPNITFLQASVQGVFSNERETGAIINDIKYHSSFVFNSILFDKPVLKSNQYWLLQHFKGWFIETQEPTFDPAVGTLMDFRTNQSEGATFFYVLPFSEKQALIEYTLFSPAVLDDLVYERHLKNYVEHTLGISTYQIKEKEFGVIPMTNYPFPKHINQCIHIGTAGGNTKGSSGYTFKFIQKEVAAIVEALQYKGHPFHSKQDSRRFHFYDSVLLRILQRRQLEGASIFTQLFKRNNASKVLQFLDNETTLPDEIKIISTLPTIPFTRAALHQLH